MRVIHIGAPSRDWFELSSVLWFIVQYRCRDHPRLLLIVIASEPFNVCRNFYAGKRARMDRGVVNDARWRALARVASEYPTILEHGGHRKKKVTSHRRL